LPTKNCDAPAFSDGFDAMAGLPAAAAVASRTSPNSIALFIADLPLIVAMPATRQAECHKLINSR
jgi:hypothetical protein